MRRMDTLILTALASVLSAGCATTATPRPAPRPAAPEPTQQPARTAEPKPPAGPVLVVPASEAPLHIAIPLPDDADVDASAPRRLVPVGESRSARGVAAEVIAVEGSPARRLLVATVPPSPGGSEAPRRFRLTADTNGGAARKRFALRVASEKSLALDDGGRPLLVYNHGTISREGVAARYDRANYFHPVYGLDGEVLTDDFPKDHYHHRGIFWAWPGVRTGEGKAGAFESWIPKRFEYRFERWTCRHAGALAGAIGAETDWLAAGKRIVRERMLVIAHPALGDARAVDFELTWTATAGPVKLKGAKGKGYGGFTFRSAPRKDTVITAPDGRTKKDLVAKRLPWADISGTFAGPDDKGPVTSGAAVFVATGHPDFPPTWLTRHYGPLCVGWPGIEEVTLEPGKPVTCRYRMWFHRGIPETGAMQSAYDAYARGLEAHWEENRP